MSYIDVLKMYEERRCTAEEAVTIIDSDDFIAIAGVACEPFTVAGKLHTLKDRGLDHISIYNTMSVGEYEIYNNPEYRDFAFSMSNFFMKTMREAWKNGNACFIPGNMHDTALRMNAWHPVTVYIGAATPMDEHGYVRLSLSNMCDKYWIENAKKVIIEINPNMPVVEGDTEVHISQITKVVEVNTPLPVIPRSTPTEVEMEIGRHVASLINDGDTIQLGIGGIPDAVTVALRDKKDLGIHTEMITSGMADLIRRGVVTGRKKTLHRGKVVGCFALGDQELYDTLDHNPSIMMVSGMYVTHPFIMSQNDNMVSVNTTLNVDLTGQIASESIGSRQYSGTGGQTDTAMAAIHSRNGRSIIALRSTAKGGSVSTINACLPLGSGVTMSRNIIDYIVTEYGVAPMRGRNIRERVDNLIAIAHPDFRQQLRADAETYGLR